MYSAQSFQAGLALPLSAVISTSFAAPPGFHSAFWVAYVVAHAVVAVMSLIAAGLALSKVLALRVERDWARSPRAHALDLTFCADNDRLAPVT